MKKLTFEILSKYRNFLMGVATISVVFFHISQQRFFANYHYGYAEKIMNRIISSSGVDIFLLLSGIGLYYSFKKNNNVREFYIKRFIRIIIPYIVICSLAYFYRDVVFLEGNGIIEFLKDFFFFSLFKDNNTWFWYILCILICYFIFPYVYNLFEKASDEETRQMRLINIFTSLLFFIYLLSKYETKLYTNSEILLLRIPVFIIGVYLGNLVYNKKEVKWYHIGMLLFNLLLCIFLRKPPKAILRRYIICQFNFSVCFFMILIIDKLRNNKILGKIINIFITIVTWIGKYSLEIYLFHVILIRFMQLYLDVPIYITSNCLIMIALTIVLSIIFKFLTDNIIRHIMPIFNKKFIDKPNKI